MRFFLLACGLLLLHNTIRAQTPPPVANPSTATKPAMNPTALQLQDLDRIVLETLKEVHNKGAALYNEGDHSGALRIYQGGLIVAKPLLAHRAKQQSAIGEGLNQIDKATLDMKVKAYRLHEVIEQTREDLKSAIKAAEPPPPLPVKAPEAAVSGKLLYNGKPANGIAIALVPAGTTKTLGSAKTGADGAFHIPTPMPPGAYIITLTGEGIPPLYTKVESTTLKADLKLGVNNLALEAK